MFEEVFDRGKTGKKKILGNYGKWENRTAFHVKKKRGTTDGIPCWDKRKKEKRKKN